MRNYKDLYEQTKRQLEKYQDKVVPELRAQLEAAEARVRDLEAQHRTEMCENGYDCVELGKARAAAVEARAKLGTERITKPKQMPNGMDEWEIPRERLLEGITRLALIEDILGDHYDLDRLRELVQADRDGRCVVLPDVDKQTRKSMADGLEDVFNEWAHEDASVGLFGMSSDEKELAIALITALKGDQNG